jgi:biotin carboxyl carrier protein
MKFYIDGALVEVLDAAIAELELARVGESCWVNGQELVVLQRHPFSGEAMVAINGKKVRVRRHTKYDVAIGAMGYDKRQGNKVSAIRAPMPGIVLHIKAAVGDVLKKGDALLTLEAMKMENILKASGDGVVKGVNVVVGAAVEKNQVLFEME